MLNLLIVDDERLEVELVKKTFDFSELGIMKIYEAFSVAQARTVLMRNDINIILCDIEMPRENGLDLLRWVRENGKDAECIFITSYAEFRYAKKAIELGSIGYVLKPIVSHELKHILNKAIEKIENKKIHNDNSRMSNLWLKHQTLLVEKLWFDILTRKVKSNREDIQNAANAINLPGLERKRILPILIRIQLMYDDPTQSDDALLIYKMKDTAYQVILGNKDNGILVEYRFDMLICMVYIDAFGENNLGMIEDLCRKFVETCSYNFKCNLSCYIGDEVLPHELVKAMQKISNCEKQSLASSNQVIRVNRPMPNNKSEIIPDMNSFLVMLEKGYMNEIVTEVERFLKDSNNRKHLNSAMLVELKHNFMQIIHAFLKDHGIKAYRLFNSKNVTRLFEIAEFSIGGFMKWLEFILHETESFIKSDRLERTTGEKVKEYIKQNLAANITCKGISEHFYLNPDYLTRIFKRETGMFINAYIAQERVKLAKKLLVKTDMNITGIAVEVGYGDNISYFSLVFKKETGKTPSEYRNHAKFKERKVINI